MNQVAIRSASFSDADALAELSGQLGYPSSSAEILKRLQVITAQQGHQVLVALIDAQMVGWSHTFIAYRVESSPFAEIGGLVVDQNHQRAGIGQQLVSASIVWAKGQGLDQIRVRSNVIRVDAHRFYMRIGFRQLKTAAVFSMPI